MNASEARNETNRALAEKSLGDIYSQILKAARNGESALQFDPHKMTGYQADALRGKGYKVVDNRGEPTPTGEHRPVESYLVSW